MATNCSKCGKEVDTLAKRRHRCRSITTTPVCESETEQYILWNTPRGFGPRPYLRKSRQKSQKRRW